MTEAPDLLRHGHPSVTDIYAQDMLEQLTGVTPLVGLELPYLARGEDRHDMVPRLGLEAICAVNKDEAGWPGRVNFFEVAGDVQHGGAGGVGFAESAAFEEVLNVGHAEDGGY